jgi:hypothetical protein
MHQVSKKFITDENNKRIAVQVDLATFEKMEGVIENYGLAKLMDEPGDHETLTVEEANSFYAALPKSK